jgi:hypothetical protein
LRGGIFRIHPDEAATSKRSLPSGVYGPGYTVPAGNFGEYWADRFQSQGNSALAAQYRDPAKVLPEVYVKGNRSNYSIGVHPTKRWLGWGEVNFGGGHDEVNLVANPAFAGQPYFHGNNESLPFNTKNPAAPMNTSPLNNGVQQLPPAVPGAINCCGGLMDNVIFGGPIYTYNQALKNRDKLPPHLHNRFFHFSLGNHLWVNTLDTNSVTITRTDRVDATLMRVPMRSPLAARIGPDGAFYLLNYDGFYSTGSPGVSRMSYLGTCFLTPTPVARPAKPASEFGVIRTLAGLAAEASGGHEFSLFDMAGRRIYSVRGGGRATYSLEALRARIGLEQGVYGVRVKSSRGVYAGSISLL